MADAVAVFPWDKGVDFKAALCQCGDEAQCSLVNRVRNDYITCCTGKCNVLGSATCSNRRSHATTVAHYLPKQRQHKP